MIITPDSPLAQLIGDAFPVTVLAFLYVFSFRGFRAMRATTPPHWRARLAVGAICLVLATLEALYWLVFHTPFHL